MKNLYYLFFCMSLTLVNLADVQAQDLEQLCADLSKGVNYRVILDLVPGRSQSVKWDLSQCPVTVQNFKVTITGPRKYAGGPTVKLARTTSIALTKKQTMNGIYSEESVALNGFWYFGQTYSNGGRYFTRGSGELDLLLESSKPVSVELTVTYGLGGDMPLEE